MACTPKPVRRRQKRDAAELRKIAKQEGVTPEQLLQQVCVKIAAGIEQFAEALKRIVPDLDSREEEESKHEH